MWTLSLDARQTSIPAQATTWEIRGRAAPNAMTYLRRAASEDPEFALGAVVPAVAALLLRGQGQRVLSLAAFAIVDADRLTKESQPEIAALNRNVAAVLVRALELAEPLCA